MTSAPRCSKSCAEGLTSPNRCGVGECGACTVLVDNIPVDSVFSAVWADGKDPAPPRRPGNRLSRVQQAHVDVGLSSGFCTPGLVMSSTAFIEKHKG
ncbi:MAG: hypothetical protein ACLSAH_23860 [Bilophila wadsworthia]